LLAIITAIINFNIGICFKNAFFVDETTLSTQTIEVIKSNKEETINIEEIKKIIDQKVNENEEFQNKTRKIIFDELEKSPPQTSFKKEEAIKLVEKASKDIFTTNIRRTDHFKFKFKLFG